MTIPRACGRRFALAIGVLSLVCAAEPVCRAANESKPRVAILIAEPEYDTKRTLPEFAAKELSKDFRVSIILGSETDADGLPGIEAVREADVLVISVRRRPLKPEQMKILRDYVSRGKPLVGIRTASHAFSLRGKHPMGNLQTWESWDADVFGGHYVNHYGVGAKVAIRSIPEAASHPILRGLNVSALVGNGSLYQVNPLAKGTKPLLIGAIPGQPVEPLAWTFVRRDGGKSFYTSLGHPDDFSNVAFRKLLFNAIRWAAGR